jgi:hypothetical protein
MVAFHDEDIQFIENNGRIFGNLFASLQSFWVKAVPVGELIVDDFRSLECSAGGQDIGDEQIAADVASDFVGIV